ncbi:MAG: ABC transporter permease [Treponema sp.]|nr:ABC transporter permease [Treponema sp.]
MKKNTSLLKSALSLLAGLLVCVAIILIFAKNPLQALSSFFTGTFTSPYYFGGMLNSAAFLMTAGCGACLAIKSGSMNLGGEGQVYAGGYVTALVLTTPVFLQQGFSVLTQALALVLCLAAGAAMALASSFLKRVRNAQVLLTSFLISAGLIPLIDSLITSSKNSREQNLLSLPFISDSFKWPQILKPSPLTLSFFIALALCPLLSYFLLRDRHGKRICIMGTAPEFAKYAGFSCEKYSSLCLAASGALHSLTGFFAVTGTYYTCHKGFYMNMGWNALSAALIVHAEPALLIPSSLSLAWLYSSADRINLTQGFAFDISGIVQGCVLFAAAFSFIRKGEAK